ncbi:Rhodanese-like protein [Xylaria intraflava]|nr:Rhodanese-like protein [Xylaria intraflava]
MSVITLSSLKFVSAEALAKTLLAASAGAGGERVAVVDVRDDDHIGGHIRGSLHFPSRSLDATMPTLLRKLDDADTVVFHCALSQQRGPGAALRYLREKEAAAAATAPAAGTGGPGKKAQTVLVLDRGFVGWQELYGSDERLTEGYRKEIWENGY